MQNNRKPGAQNFYMPPLDDNGRYLSIDFGVHNFVNYPLP